MKMLACIDPTEKAKQEAIFSYNTVDLTNPPLILHNPYNQRPLSKLQSKKLRNALIQEGLRVFSSENRIMVVISPSDVEEGCITSDLMAPPAPLCLKEGSQLTELTNLGGQHRQDAVCLIKAENDRQIKQLKGSISAKVKLVKGLPATDKARQRKSELENEIEALKLQLSLRESSKELVGTWGVMLLDPGESYVVFPAHKRSLSGRKDQRRAPY